jgi:hypothetical protein
MPPTGSKSSEYNQHLQYDGVGINPAAAGFAQGGSVTGADGFMENLQGHRSGVSAATPWALTPGARPSISAYGDSNASGAGTTYAAASLTDATPKAWGVADANVGATVTYAATTITDTARNNANGWVAGNTAQYAGALVITATGKIGIIASVALGVATLTADGWRGGTPAAGEAYRINPNNGFVGRQITSIGAGNAVTKGVILCHIATVATITAWSNGTPANGSPYVIGPPDITGEHYVGRVGGENADNFYKAMVEEGNTQVV